MNFDKVSLRKLNDNVDEYKLLEKWYQQEKIYLQFEQRKLNLEEVKKKYYPRTLEDAIVPVYIIEYDNVPVGIIQYKLLDDESKIIYGLNEDNIYELDIFIGELTYHRKGIGYKSIMLISKYLFEEKNADLLVMCPLKDNNGAINCYKKCDFKIINKYVAENTIGVLQEYILMVKEHK